MLRVLLEPLGLLVVAKFLQIGPVRLCGRMQYFLGQRKDQGP